MDEAEIKTSETIPESKIYRKETRSCITLGFGIMLLFSSFLALQNLQGSLNTESGLGVISLCCLYAAAIVSAFCAPLVISKLGTKRTFLMAFVGHLIYVSSNFYPSFFTLIPSSIIVGAITGPLWTSLGIYLTTCAFALHERTGMELHVALSRMNGIFFTMFEFSGFVGNPLSSLVLYQGSYNKTITNSSYFCGVNDCPNEETVEIIASPDSRTVYIMLGVFLGLVGTGLGIIAAFLIPISPLKEQTPITVRKSLLALLVVTVKTDIKFMIPLMFYMAIEMTLCYAELTKSFISCPIGIQNVGYVMTVFSGCASTVAFLSSVFGKFLRRYVMIIGASLLEIALLTWMYHWVPGQHDTLKIYVLATTWGLAQGVWKTQMGGIIGDIFSEDKQAAFALYECTKYVAFSVSFAYSSFVCMRVKLVLAMGTLVVGVILYGLVEIRFARRIREEVVKPEEETVLN